MNFDIDWPGWSLDVHQNSPIQKAHGAEERRSRKAASWNRHDLRVFVVVRGKRFMTYSFATLCDLLQLRTPSASHPPPCLVRVELRSTGI